jgi:hypothetical protein
LKHSLGRQEGDTVCEGKNIKHSNYVPVTLKIEIKYWSIYGLKKVRTFIIKLWMNG